MLDSSLTSIMKCIPILPYFVLEENVLINSDGRVKISDMGIAGITACRNIELDESGLNHTVVGTARYMSPERLFDKAYGSPSDIWSFGLVLLECSTGTYPLSNDKEDDQLLKPKRKHRKNFQSLVELSILLEDFEIDRYLEQISHQGYHCCDKVDWKSERNKPGGIAEFLRLCMYTDPGKSN